ncbi:MAG TPA: hypothetical protein VFQ39_05740 [Longimicrobium sp.]|nr:hypothetical protein [Longimicrobium sp.]
MKKKIRMNVEKLEIASFEPQETPEARGTVRGHGSWGCTHTCYSCEPPATCGGNTCQFESCDGVCGSWLCTP